MKQIQQLYEGAERLNNVPMSKIRVIMNRVKQLEQEGKTIISLSAGEPNFNTPDLIKEETIKALAENHTHYASNIGQPMLRKEIAVNYYENQGVTVNPDKQILITCGGAEGLNIAIMSLVNPNDEVIFFAPAFVNYEALIIEAGAKAIKIPLREEQNFQISLEEVKQKITDHTKMLILNNPNNPSGAVYGEEILKQLVQLAVTHHFIILSDEIYSDILYDHYPIKSIAAIEGAEEHFVIISGFSKTFAMTGWRLGYLITSSRYMAKMIKHHQFTTTCIPTFIQDGTAKAMNQKETKETVKKMTGIFEERRNRICSILDEIPEVTYIKPRGAFYIMVNVSGCGLSGNEFAEKLLNEKEVAVIPGNCFGDEYQNYIRISYAASDNHIAEGMKRISDMIHSL